MKFIKTFEDWNQVSPELKAHLDEDLDLTNSFFRLGSDAYIKLFEEVKQYWDSGNVILKGPSAWMAKNLEVGKKAIYKPRGGSSQEVKLDSPKKGGKKKFIVYRNSGKTDKEGNIINLKINDESLEQKENTVKNIQNEFNEFFYKKLNIYDNLSK